MNHYLLLMRKKKRNEMSVNDANKDSYNEREINFIYQNKEESKKIMITYVKQLKQELKTMVFPYYESTQGIKKAKINLDNEKNIIFFSKIHNLH